MFVLLLGLTYLFERFSLIMPFEFRDLMAVKGLLSLGIVLGPSIECIL
jgi:hypothetical protein